MRAVHGISDAGGPVMAPVSERPNLGHIERSFTRVVERNGQIVYKPIVRRAREGGYLSRDGRTAYYFDGKQLRRVTHAMPTGETNGA